MDIVIDSMDVKLLNITKVAREREVVGTVVNIFDKVVNIETRLPTSLLTIANTKVLQGPYIMKINNESLFNCFKQTLNMGDIVRFKEDGEMIVNNYRLFSNSAALWECEMRSRPVSQQEMVNLHSEINHFLTHEGKLGGILNAFLTQPSKNTGEALILSIYDNYFNRLITQLSEDFTGENMRNFIGLGVGLTPSGDDFIVGLLAALCSCEAGRDDEKKIKKELTKESVANKTTRVSTHMIKYALDGEFNEALLDLLSGSKPVHTSLKEVNSIGSTSGTDMLVGVSFALEQLIKKY